ncbi:UBP1-associated protein 2A-like isoform X3 [Camellia sinensis]|uniref:UBP1-associated protein 2A-like isoform X3 n=1 Tax=Camellia sinensis TaxID=4442 RepID=UPI001036CDD7|nr:UBP1-associated protein 2A-like isoform X3 [Camellia sinensis]
MARKRKLVPKSTEPQLKKQQREVQQLQYYAKDEQDDDQEAMDGVVGPEEYEEDQDQQHYEDGDDNDDEEQEDDDDEEPFQKLLEPFSKEQLINLLSEAAENHADVANRIYKIANSDPSQRKIFVHGLGWDTNSETLINAFKHYGEIEDCKAVCDKISGKSKGYGFILFKTPAVPVAPLPPAPASEYTQRKIYVSNVSADLDPQKLVSFFSKYGEIEEGPLGLDKQTGQPRGFCLFVYRTIESAKKALMEPHKNFEGHILHCQRAIDGPKQSKSHSLHNPNLHNPQFQRNETTSFVGSASGPGHLMAPSGPTYNQGAAVQGLNPALGQALTALLATQGASLGLTNLLGTLGGTGVGSSVNPTVPGASHGMQGGYGNQGVVGGSVSSGATGGYGNHQMGYQNQNQNQQIGQGGSIRSQHGVGNMGGIRPYMGH